MGSKVDCKFSKLLIFRDAIVIHPSNSADELEQFISRPVERLMPYEDNLFTDWVQLISSSPQNRDVDRILDIFHAFGTIPARDFAVDLLDELATTMLFYQYLSPLPKKSHHFQSQFQS